jgi:hypothetical protein
VSFKLPPAVEFFLGETSDEPMAPAELVSWMKRSCLAKEFQDCGQRTIADFDYADSPGHDSAAAGTFRLCPMGALDPLSRFGQCISPDCRAANAEAFARSVALYGEEIFLVDDLTGMLAFADLNSPVTAAYLLAARASLKKLEPLLRAGILRLGAPIRRYCEQCGNTIKSFQESAAERLCGELLERVKYALSPEHMLRLKLSEDDIIGIVRVIKATDAATLRVSEQFIEPTVAEMQILRPFLLGDARKRVSQLFMTSTLAQRTRGALATCDRQDAGTFTSLAGWTNSDQKIEELERLQSIELPYIEDLTVEELLELRDTAGLALPRFRNFLSSRILEASGPECVRTAIQELKEGVTDVEAELHALQAGRKLKFAAGTAMVVLSVVVAEVTSFPTVAAAAFAGALAAFNGLHPQFAKDETDTVRQKTLPSYVLWKARDLLRHRGC